MEITFSNPHHPSQPAKTNAAPTLPEGRDAAIRAAAQSLEAGFLAEMLRHAGVARPPSTANGGPGEEAFAGFLADAYAEALVERGGIGLSDQLAEALIRAEVSASGGLGHGIEGGSQ